MTLMATKDSDAANTPVAANVPPPAVQDDTPKAGPGQVVVTSPTGLRSVVEEHLVDSLKPQGYKVG
jgi:hypothetical protein